MLSPYNSALGERTSLSHELDIIRRLKEKEEKALAELYDLYARVLFSIVLKIIKNEEDSKDTIQAIFMQVWERVQYFDFEKGNVYSWLITIARNKALDKVRSKEYKVKKQKLDELNESELTDAEASSLDLTIAQEKARIIKSALERISPEQRAVIELAFFEGYSHSEISERLNLPLGTIKTRIRQGMKKLHSIIKNNL